MLVIATWVYVGAELPIDENKPLDRARRYTSWGDFGAAISPWNSVSGNRGKRYTSFGDWGAAVSPWNSVSANHRSHPCKSKSNKIIWESISFVVLYHRCLKIGYSQFSTCTD